MELVAEAVVLEHVADSYVKAAAICIRDGNRVGANHLWRLARNERLKALLARGLAAALLGRELPEEDA